MDRAGIIDDAFHLAISGDYSYGEALDLVKYVATTGNVSLYQSNYFTII